MNSRYPALAPAQAWQLAYQWLCQRRRHYPANADIWHLRFHWPARSATLFARVMAGHYRLSPMQLLGGHAIWSAEDALVLKWVALRVAPRLPWHPACEHGRGMGVVASRRRLHDFLQGAGGSHPYVLRTDIRGYYQHIDRARVLSRLVAPLPCPVCRELMRQYLYYSVECGGEFHTPSSGISRGCALSPLIGASLLWHIDADFAARGELYYARYMDDFIVLARTRWRLRDAVRRLNGYLAADGFSQHPAKTWIGRLDRGIDWLGGWYTTQGRVGIAPNALQRYRTKSLRLYEQTLRAGNPETECQRRVRGYLQRWRIHTAAPLGQIPIPVGGVSARATGVPRIDSRKQGNHKPTKNEVSMDQALTKGARPKTGTRRPARGRRMVRRATVCAACALFSVDSPAAPVYVGPQLQEVEQIVPNRENHWVAKITYIAVPYEPEWVAVLGSATALFYQHHLDNTWAYGRWAVFDYRGGIETITLKGTPEQKLASINKEIFHTDSPVPGMIGITGTSDNNTDNNSNLPRAPEAVCTYLNTAKIYGDVNDLKHVPAMETYPPGSPCKTFPPRGDSNDCMFSLPAATIDLGTIGQGGGKTGYVGLEYTCTGAGSFTMSVLGIDKGKISGTYGVATLRTESGPLPAKVEAGAGVKHMVTVYADFVAAGGKTGAFSYTAPLLIELD